MKKKNNYNFLLFGIIFIFFGLSMLIYGKTIPTIMIILLGYLLIIKSLFNFINLIFKKNNKIINIIISFLLEIIFGIFLIFKAHLALSFISIIFAIYLLIFSIINIIDLTLHITNNVKGKISLVINIIINITFFFLLISSPYKNFKLALLIISIYLILYGVNKIFDFIIEVIPSTYKDKIKYQIHLSLPIILVAIIPPQLIRKFNKTLDLENSYTSKNGDKKNDLEIIIHLAESGTAIFGHVDIAYNNKVYSYGNYNRHSRKLFNAIGDGIFMIADKDKYIDYMVKKQHRYLIVYGLDLTNNQKKLLEKNIEDNVYKNTVDWYSDVELSNKEKNNAKTFTDMSSELHIHSDAIYKKVNKGKNKIFFVFKTNCTLMAETLIRPLGRAVLPISGIITPGTYYDCLEKEYKKKNSNVISKNIYYNKNDQ